MRLDNRFSDKPLYNSYLCTRQLSGAEDSTTPLLLTEEHVLTLFVNGAQVHTFICSPSQLTELCVGWMISEGLISCPEDIAVLTVSEDGRLAEAQTAGCSDPLRPFLACQAPDPLRIARAMECLYHADTTHARTHGTHGCVLSAGDGSVTLFEDIGRYNAADKAIGAAVLRGLPREQCMLFSSGRVPEGMILKMVRSRIPVLVSKAVATVSAVEAARTYNVTLCFSAREDSYVCHPEQAVLSGGADTK